MENNINLTPDAVKAIQALQHPCGTYQFYRAHLDRLFNYILNYSDEIGMSDNEAMHTLRALNALRSDIADIASAPAQLNEPVDPFDGITLTAIPERIDCDDNEAPTLEEVTTAFKEAWESLKTARYAMFRLLHFSEKAESIEELRNLTEHIERAMVKIGELREQETTDTTQTADTTDDDARTADTDD